jgi:signal transduction histidine kinase
MDLGKTPQAAARHELNNLLTAIAGYAQLIVEDDDTPPGIRQDAAAIAEAADRAVEVSKQL